MTTYGESLIDKYFIAGPIDLDLDNDGDETGGIENDENDGTGDPTNLDFENDDPKLEVDSDGGMTQIAQTRVVNGNATTIEHFPWIVSMQYYGSHRCGGSIITTNRILTAAHCTINIVPNLLSIRAGSTDSQVGGELVAVTDFTNHHLYNPTTLENDISVMVIASRLTTGANVAVIPLPMQGAPVNEGIVGDVAGWGALCEKCPGITTLQYVGLPVLSNANCNAMYGGSVAPGMICAGFVEGGRDACQGMYIL